MFQQTGLERDGKPAMQSKMPLEEIQEKIQEEIQETQNGNTLEKTLMEPFVEWGFKKQPSMEPKRDINKFSPELQQIFLGATF